MESIIFLRNKQVRERTGLSRSTIYSRIAEGTFPKQVSLGGRAVGWIESEINSWLEEQVSRSRNEQTGHSNQGDVFRKLENQTEVLQ